MSQPICQPVRFAEQEDGKVTPFGATGGVEASRFGYVVEAARFDAPLMAQPAATRREPPSNERPLFC